MKILLLTFSIYPSYQDGIIGIAEELSKKGHDVWTCYSKDSNVKTTNQTKRIKVPKKNGICMGLFDIKTLISICRWINKERFDCVYIESVHLWNIPLLMFCKKTSYYCAIHDVNVHNGDKHAKLLYKIYRYEISRSKQIVVRNDADISVFSRNFGVPREKIKYIPLNYPFPNYNSGYSRQGTVLFFGRINPYKGLDNLLKIAKLLPNIKFLVYGKSTNEVLPIIEECKKESNIVIKDEFIDYKSMPQIFGSCDCVILPYKSASQSGVIIDAYRFSKPVIAFNVGAFNEEIQNERTGYLINQGDVKSFTEAILRIENLSEEEYSEMSRSAYGFGFDMFSNYTASKAFIEMIER